jgi:hypothetical protein
VPGKILLFPLLILSAAMYGCSTVAHEPGIKTVIQRVEVPIYMPCAAEIPEKPKFNFDNLKLDNDLFDKVKALLSDRHLHIGYQEELLAALKSCK